MDPTTFETHPSRYHHWKLVVAGDVATLTMAVDGDHPHKPGYELKLNSRTTWPTGFTPTGRTQ